MPNYQVRVTVHKSAKADFMEVTTEIEAATAEEAFSRCAPFWASEHFNVGGNGVRADVEVLQDGGVVLTERVTLATMFGV